MTDTRPGPSGRQEPGAWGPSRSLTPQSEHRPLGESFSATPSLDVWTPLLLTVEGMDGLCLCLRLLHYLSLPATFPVSLFMHFFPSIPPSLYLSF